MMRCEHGLVRSLHAKGIQLFHGGEEVGDETSRMRPIGKSDPRRVA